MWSYDITNLAEVKNQVRFLIQDTDTNEQLVQDEEIAFAVASSSGIVPAAAAILCRKIALHYGKQMDVKGSDTQWLAKEKYVQYMQMAADFAAQSAAAQAATQDDAPLILLPSSPVSADSCNANRCGSRMAFSRNLHLGTCRN